MSHNTGESKMVKFKLPVTQVTALIAELHCIILVGVRPIPATHKPERCFYACITENTF